MKPQLPFLFCNSQQSIYQSKKHQVQTPDSRYKMQVNIPRNRKHKTQRAISYRPRREPLPIQIITKIPNKIVLLQQQIPSAALICQAHILHISRPPSKAPHRSRHCILTANPIQPQATLLNNTRFHPTISIHAFDAQQPRETPQPPLQSKTSTSPQGQQWKHS